jgi:hypothetical protein
MRLAVRRCGTGYSTAGQLIYTATGRKRQTNRDGTGVNLLTNMEDRTDLLGVVTSQKDTFV